MTKKERIESMSNEELIKLYGRSVGGLREVEIFSKAWEILAEIVTLCEDEMLRRMK